MLLFSKKRHFFERNRIQINLNIKYCNKQTCQIRFDIPTEINNSFYTDFKWQGTGGDEQYNKRVPQNN